MRSWCGTYGLDGWQGITTGLEGGTVRTDKSELARIFGLAYQKFEGACLSSHLCNADGFGWIAVKLHAAEAEYFCCALSTRAVQRR